MCSWIISLIEAMECFINDPTERSQFPERRSELMVEVRSSTLTLTPEETSHLVIWFPGITKAMKKDACAELLSGHSLEEDG